MRQLIVTLIVFFASILQENDFVLEICGQDYFVPSLFVTICKLDQQ